MTKQQHKNAAHFHRLIVEFETALLAGKITPQAIADHFNINGITTLMGIRWTSMTVNRFLYDSVIDQPPTASLTTEKTAAAPKKKARPLTSQIAPILQP